MLKWINSGIWCHLFDFQRGPLAETQQGLVHLGTGILTEETLKTWSQGGWFKGPRPNHLPLHLPCKGLPSKLHHTGVWPSSLELWRDSPRPYPNTTLSTYFQFYTLNPKAVCLTGESAHCRRHIFLLYLSHMLCQAWVLCLVWFGRKISMDHGYQFKKKSEALKIWVQNICKQVLNLLQCRILIKNMCSASQTLRENSPPWQA